MLIEELRRTLNSTWWRVQEDSRSILWRSGLWSVKGRLMFSTYEDELPQIVEALEAFKYFDVNSLRKLDPCILRKTYMHFGTKGHPIPDKGYYKYFLKIVENIEQYNVKVDSYDLILCTIYLQALGFSESEALKYVAKGVYKDITKKYSMRLNDYSFSPVSKKIKQINDEFIFKDFDKDATKKATLSTKKRVSLSNIDLCQIIDRPEARQLAVNYLKELVPRIAEQHRETIDKHGLKLITFEGIVEQYYKNKTGKTFKYNTGANKPKVSKQLKKQGIDYTDFELVCIGELRKWFLNAQIERKPNLVKARPVLVDMNDFEIPNDVNVWAFNYSCNNSRSCSGSHTHLVLKDLGVKYLKFFTVDNGNVEPLARTYFVKDGDDFGHAGTYTDVNHPITESDIDHIALDATSFLIASLFGIDVNKFRASKGINLYNYYYYITGYHTRCGDAEINVWANLSNENDYKKVETREGLLSELSVKSLKGNHYDI